MTIRSLNHTDTVVSALLASPFIEWDEWRAIEKARLDVLLNPQALIDSLEEVRHLFNESMLLKMNATGTELLHDMLAGGLQARCGFDRCLERWDTLPYFTEEYECIADTDEVMSLFFRYPWFFYLIITDPAL